MVVFQYGSIVLFNVREHEVDEYLNLVRKHASGLLPEMRKDGKLSYCFYFDFQNHNVIPLPFRDCSKIWDNLIKVAEAQLVIYTFSHDGDDMAIRVYNI